MTTELNLNDGNLKQAFEIESLTKYIDYQPLRDKKAGFSILRDYPTGIQYKPLVTSEGKSVTTAVIFVFCIFPYEQTENIDLTKIPLVVKIDILNRYLGNHFDYNFDDQNCPTRESVELNKHSPKPVSLESIDQYFYNFTENKLKDINNNIIGGEKILDEIFEAHCNTVHFIKGLKVQWQMGSKRVGIKLVELLIQLLIWLLRHITGRILEAKKEIFAGSLKPYQEEDMRLLNTDKINIFNYEASKNIIITFCCGVVLWHTLVFIFNINIPYIKSLSINSTVLLCTAIIILWVLDNLLPKGILWLINKLISLKVYLMFLKMKL